MKRMTLGTAAVLAALTLAACGGGDPDTEIHRTGDRGLGPVPA